jgi:gliding motility-associated-like protein
LPAMAGAQNCPPNIDFEYGNFDNWTCYIGITQSIAGRNVITLTPTNGGGPSFDRHTLLPANSGADFFGGFPVNCPNGSGFSVKLGNETGGAQAEGIAYEFTIPPNQNNYSIRYHYAVVFQDPRHEIHQQPRLEIEAKNLTDNEVIDCSSFSFYPYGSLLPGFEVSPIQRDSTDIWYKDWTSVSINLNNRAGKTIRLFFKTGDCTFTRHFGYAYIDVDTDCGSEFIGDAFCPGDTVAAVTAPFGFQSYTWFNSDFTQTLSNGQTLFLRPPPPPGTIFPVELIPYGGYGCPDTAYAVLRDTLVVRSQAGQDALSCNQTPVPIGANPKPNLVYEWSPTLGLSNPSIANPRAGPSVNTQYILTTRSLGGGCASSDTVIVQASIIDNRLTLLGKPAFCITTGDSAVLLVQPTTSIQWFNNDSLITGETKTRYKALQSGLYHALLTNNLGCSTTTAKQEILIEMPRRGISYPIQFAAINEPQELEARDFAATVSWSPPNDLSNPQAFKPVFAGQKDQVYIIRLETRGGCVTIDTQAVKVYKEINFYVPGAFTPNGDGLNDYLKPIAAGIKNFRYFRIFNRWGQLIFDLNQSPVTGWDGTFRGLPQPLQTVVWVAEGIGVNGKSYKKQGTTVLIR